MANDALTHAMISENLHRDPVASDDARNADGNNARNDGVISAAVAVPGDLGMLGRQGDDRPLDQRRKVCIEGGWVTPIR